MFIKEMTKEELQIIESIGLMKTNVAGDVIIEEGSTGSSFFLIISGKVEVRKNIGNGKYKKLMELGPCGLIGEVCFLGIEFRSASVVAVEDTTTLEFERADFEKLVAENPVIGMKVYRGMAQELARRLVKVDDELKDAITWALKDLMLKGEAPQITLPKPVTLKLADEKDKEVL